MRIIFVILTVLLLSASIAAQECMQYFGMPDGGCPSGSSVDTEESYPACVCNPGTCYMGAMIGCLDPSDLAGEPDVTTYDHLGNCKENCDPSKPYGGDDKGNCYAGYHWEEGGCVPDNYDDSPDYGYDDDPYDYGGEETGCGNNEKKNWLGECVCLDGYQVYDSRIGCEAKWSCGSNAYEEDGECYCKDGYKMNMYGACVQDYARAKAEKNAYANLPEDKQMQILQLLKKGQEAKTEKERREVEARVADILYGGDGNINTQEEEPVKKDRRIKDSPDKEMDSRIKKDMKHYNTLKRLYEIQKRYGREGRVIDLSEARRIADSAYQNTDSNVKDAVKTLNSDHTTQIEDSGIISVDDLTTAWEVGSESSKETAKIVKAQADKINTATKKGRNFLINVNKLLDFAKENKLPKSEIDKINRMKANVESMLGKTEGFANKLTGAAGNLESLSKIMDGDLSEMATKAEEYLNKYNGAYKDLAKKWIKNANGIKAVGDHFEKLGKGDFEGISKDLKGLIDKGDIKGKNLLVVKRLKTFSDKVDRAKKFGEKIKVTELIAFYKDVEETQKTLRGGAGKTAAGVLGFTRIVDNLANAIKIGPVRDAIKLVNSVPTKMIKFTVDYQQHVIKRLDESEVGRDVSKETATSVFLRKHGNVQKYAAAGEKDKTSKLFTIKYQDGDEEKQVSYKENEIKWVQKKGTDFIVPVHVDKDYEIAGDVIYKVKDEAWYMVGSCNKMEIYSNEKVPRYLGWKCI